MKKIFLILVLFSVNLNILADVSVKGYYRKSGTYVQPYVRENPKDNNTVKVKGFYRKSGTYVHPYQRSTPKKTSRGQALKLH